MNYEPKFLIMTTTNNNNKYYNLIPNGDIVNISYGRVGVTEQKTSYPISQFNTKYNEKIKKGYIDVTHLKQELIEEEISLNGDSTYREIENIVIAKIVQRLQDMANKTIKTNYTIGSGSVTQKMVDAAQEILNDLVKINNTDEFNEYLLKLFAVIPRKMKNVNDYLADDTNGFNKIIENEQSLLDVMAGQVYKRPSTVTSTALDEIKAEDCKPSILDELGLEFTETTDDEVRMIKKLMGNSVSKYYNSWKVINKDTQKRFDKFVKDNSIKDTKLLVHGSRNENFWSIIKTGMKIRPSNAVYTGSMFNDGIYMGNTENPNGAQKSIGYTSLNGYWTRENKNFAFLALFETAYGNPYVIYNHNSECYKLNYDYLQKKNPPCHCTHAKADKGMLRNDEIVFYKPEQVTIQYLVEIR